MKPPPNRRRNLLVQSQGVNLEIVSESFPGREDLPTGRRMLAYTAVPGGGGCRLARHTDAELTRQHTVASPSKGN